MKYDVYLAHVCRASECSFDEFISEINSSDYRIYKIIYAVAHNDFEDLIKLSRINMKQFAEKYDISYITLQNWKYKTRSAPTYVIELLGYAMLD